MKIHWKLINQYIEKAECGCDCSRYNCDDNGCLTYVSCGPKNRCPRPCKHCLYWTGYGLDYEDSLEESGVIL